MERTCVLVCHSALEFAFSRLFLVFISKNAIFIGRLEWSRNKSLFFCFRVDYSRSSARCSAGSAVDAASSDYARSSCRSGVFDADWSTPRASAGRNTGKYVNTLFQWMCRVVEVIKARRQNHVFLPCLLRSFLPFPCFTCPPFRPYLSCLSTNSCSFTVIVVSPPLVQVFFFIHVDCQ